MKTHLIKALSVFACLPVASFAGSLSVGPTRVDLSRGTPLAVVMVRNTGVSPTIVQVDTVNWSRDESGQDTFSETRALIATPAVFELQPGQQREVRVGVRDRSQAAVNSSFRLYLREVNPTAVAANTLQFALRIGIPVYVGGATSPLKTVALNTN